MILFRHILKNHIAPFLFATVSLIFIFLLQFLMKFADRLVGKGLGTLVVIQLISYNLAWMVVLVVPMAVLIATLMAFGGMAQNNEITIMKATGVSLYKMIIPPFLASIIICYLLILFNNKILPDANHQAKNLMVEISRKKPTLSLESGVFSQEIPNYAILVRDVDQNSNQLRQITIYDYSNPIKVNVVTAKKGNIVFSNDQTKLIMNLEEGEIHETDIQQTSLYRKLLFTKHRIIMNADQFLLHQSGPGEQRGDRELSAQAMMYIVDSLSKQKQNIINRFSKFTARYFFVDSIPNAELYMPPIKNNRKAALQRTADRINEAKNILTSNGQQIDGIDKEIDKFMVEVYKKYSIPFACIVFVLIGAPLGTMAKKGGFGFAASISLVFFVIYWAFLIGGEKLADRGLVTPFWGMWSANACIGIFGVLILIRAAKEVVNLNFGFLQRFIPKSFRSQEEAQQ